MRIVDCGIDELGTWNAELGSWDRESGTAAGGRCHFGAAFTRAACDRLALSVDHMDEVDNVDGEWTAWTLMT